MKWYSTRDAGRERPFPLKEAALMGLASDGGLFMPESIPQVDLNEVKRRADLSFQYMASYLAELFFGDDFKSPDSLAKTTGGKLKVSSSPAPASEMSNSYSPLEEVCSKAFDFEIPLVEIAPGMRTLELFHGPTFAFKDVGARFMGRMFGKLVARDERIVVLTATSGDTGSAVAGGFYGVEGVDVVILFPEGKVSEFQRAQMTTLGGNIHAIEVNGTFDDCQRMVKECFCDSSLRARVNITSANSINVLRWIPQSFYYFYAWCKSRGASVDASSSGSTSVGNAAVGGVISSYAPVVVVPSGNFGNIAAGILAQKMGLPIKKFVCASNANDIVPKFLESGIYSPMASVHTVANAMDVGNPSNFERLEALYGSREAIRRELAGFSFSDAQICDAIGRIHSRHGYFSDPHSATGFLAWERVMASMGPDTGGFWVSTAHPAKFGDTVNSSTGVKMPLPDIFKEIMGRRGESLNMAADVKELRNYLVGNYSNKFS